MRQPDRAPQNFFLVRDGADRCYDERASHLSQPRVQTITQLLPKGAIPAPLVSFQRPIAAQEKEFSAIFCPIWAIDTASTLTLIL
jgi:hypothetical protein